ncbi:PREDICTED: hydroxycarboxylic acid receptor 2-like [Nanorana parkeri]|uniref:hydroxycarboxylic acid receptor 2-like n=1 Tax=Nanorana parkeri TaxID=125878 RepID=UPI0008541FB4|nr:PREDICTED: hydroxycarboxylic acid receptor 2-like [Nanorana parkeri]
MLEHGNEGCQNRSNCTCCMFEDPILSYMLPPILIIIFVLGTVLNGFALWAFCFHIKTWKSSTVFLFNLSVADFLLMICLPFRTDYYWRNKTWAYGDIPCRLMLFMLAMNRAGSIFFLTLVATDRYIRVVHPYSKINSLSTKVAAAMACAVWFVTILMTASILTKVHTGGAMSTKAYCDSFMVCPAASWWHDLLFIFQFFLPLCIVLFCTGCTIWRLRQRNLNKNTKIKKAVKCIITVGIVFFICYLPSVSTRIDVVRIRASPERDECSLYRTIDKAFYITVCFTYINSMCNPLVYYFSSPSLRKFYLNILQCSSQAESESDAGPNNTNNTSMFPSNDQI